MPRLEFLMEELSMEAALEILLPKILPPQWKINENVFLRPHQGKGDLRKSIPTKVRAFAHQREVIGIVVLHDQDANDCVELKQNLLSLCSANLQGVSPPPAFGPHRVPGTGSLVPGGYGCDSNRLPRF